MLVNITSTSITTSEVTLEGTNLEVAIANPYQDFDELPTVTFSFSLEAEKYNQFNYLFTIITKNKKCASQKSLGAKIEALIGQNLNLNESFIVD